MVDKNDKRLVVVPFEEASKPPNGIIEHISDSWWICTDEGVVFWRQGTIYPQCNRNREVTERIKADLFSWAEVKHMPSVFRRVKIRDYR